MTNRNTVQRRLVLEAVKQLFHPTAEEVYGMVAREHPNVSKATVYRNLNLLADKGQIRRVQLLDAAIRFDGSLSNHFHAQCRGCGQVLDVAAEQTFQDMSGILADQGFWVEGQEVLFHGLCASCLRKQKEGFGN
jgi:Fe2+ or Zn2+ uptake regulation protein